MKRFPRLNPQARATPRRKRRRETRPTRTGVAACKLMTTRRESSIADGPAIPACRGPPGIVAPRRREGADGGERTVSVHSHPVQPGRTCVSTEDDVYELHADLRAARELIFGMMSPTEKDPVAAAAAANTRRLSGGGSVEASSPSAWTLYGGWTVFRKSPRSGAQPHGQRAAPVPCASQAGRRRDVASHVLRHVVPPRRPQGYSHARGVRAADDFAV